MSMWERQQGYKNKQRLGSTSQRKGQNCGRVKEGESPHCFQRLEATEVGWSILALRQRSVRSAGLVPWSIGIIKEAPIITIEPGVGLCYKSPTRSAWDAPNWMHKSQSNEPSDDARWHPRSADLPGTARWAHGLAICFLFFPHKIKRQILFWLLVCP